jgi:hypothetical protein
VRRARFILIVFILIFLLADGIYYAFWRSTRISSINESFDGLHTTRSDRTVRLLVVHGIGRHCIGYSHDLSQGLADALGLQKDSSSKSFRNIVQALDDEPRQKARSEWLKNIKQQYGHDKPIKEVLNQQQIDMPPEGWPLMDENCGFIGLPEYVNKDHPNTSENAQFETCRAIHNRKTEGSMDCQRIELNFKLPAPEEPGFGPPQGKLPSFISGFVRTHSYSGKNSRVPSLRVYELTWDRSTRSVKEEYLRSDSSSARRWHTRWWLNTELKSTIVNDSIPDAVLYLSNIYRPLFQYVILQGFCKLISDEKDAQGEDFNCLRDMKNILPEDEFSMHNDLVIITHSLGTRMVFDVLGHLGDEEFFNKLTSDLMEKNEALGLGEVDSKILERVNHLKVVFARSLSKLFTLANQVPLLELSELTNPLDYGSGSKKRDLGIGFTKFLELRKAPLQVVTFTDPNDLLSYDLKCWYDRHVLRWRDHVESAAKTYATETGNGTRIYYEQVFTCPPPTDGEWLERYRALWNEEKRSIQLVDVSVGFHGWKSFRPIIADPSSAHSRYFQKGESAVHRLIACGGEPTEEPRACPKPQWP